MKKNRNNLFNLCLLTFLLLGHLVAAQNPKTIEKSFDGKLTVSIIHRNGPLNIYKSTDGKVRVKAQISAESRDQEALDIVYDHFDVDFSDSGNQLRITTKFEIKNWNSNNGSIRLDFKDGARVRNLRNLKLSMEVWVPNLETLNVENKYEDIIIAPDISISKECTIKAYSNHIEIGNLGGKLNLSAKYSKGKVGNFNEGKLDLYDCKLEFGNGNATTLNSKYSKLVIGNLGTAQFTTYDDKIEMGNISGDLALTDKYSDIKIGNFQNGRFDIFDSDLVLGACQDLQIKSKYAKWEIQETESINFELSFDDKVRIEKSGSLVAESKYTEFEIGALQKKLVLSSFDDKVTIEKFTGPVEGIDFKGKYTDLTASLPSGLKYRIEADVKYGKFEYPGMENDFQFGLFKEKGDQLVIEGRNKGASANSPLIKVVSFDGKIILN